MMKRQFFNTKYIRFASSVFAFFVLILTSGCDAPSFSVSDMKTLEKNPSATDKILPATTLGGTFSGVGDIDFIMGFDASYVDVYEKEKNVVYKDTNGEEIDFFVILRKHGINTVRLRLWVDPTHAVENGVTNSHNILQGDNTLERTIKMAKRVKNAGLKFMLDFHYSDIWTDPAKQVIPKSWQTITTSDEMAAKVKSYTKETLEALQSEGLKPDYVQVGNEIDSGILLHTKKTASSTTDAAAAIKGTGDNLKKYLVAGCQAVREFDGNIKIILHVTNRIGKVQGIISTMDSSESLYDIIGISFYPWEKDHRTIADLKTNIQAVKTAGKKAIVAETSMHWNNDSSDDSISKLHFAYQHLVGSGGSVYDDLTTSKGTISSVTEGLQPGEYDILKGTVPNQKNAIRHIIEETAGAEGIGVCVWGGDMNGDWKYAFFGDDGTAFSSIDVFKTNVNK